MPHVIGTAGHVDHGKSALIQALTGTDPDRLAEEKARGLTIDLGFAWTTLPSGREVGFVDVPGHERFVHNMLAGVGGVGSALFVVDASEGWRPQSAEHLAILDLLAIPAGVVALTKVDLVDQATRDRVAARCRGSLARLGTGHLDLYQVHWPNPLVAQRSTMAGMRTLQAGGLVRQVGVSNYGLGRWKAAEAALAAVPQVETAYSVAGEDSHLLVVRTRSIAELSDVLQRLQGIDGVARTRTAVVLGTPVRRPPTV